MTVDGVRGWWSFDHRPRFVSNYAGIRNRISILSEAYSYLSFEDRVLATERFVNEILHFLHGRKLEARALVNQAVAEDAQNLPGTIIPVRASLTAEPPEAEILMGAVSEESNPYSGELILLRKDVVIPERMPAGISFDATAWERAPKAYLLSPEAHLLAERLRAHGVRLETLAEDGWRGPGEVFRVETLRTAPQPFQGRTEQGVEGAWIQETIIHVPSGGWRIPVNQPLGRLAILLLEPRSDDGFVSWGFLEPWLSEGRPLPLWREP
jgi:hypothetical protein